jgi:hypothetical protein
MFMRTFMRKMQTVAQHQRRPSAVECSACALMAPLVTQQPGGRLSIRMYIMTHIVIGKAERCSRGTGRRGCHRARGQSWGSG